MNSILVMLCHRLPWKQPCQCVCVLLANTLEALSLMCFSVKQKKLEMQLPINYSILLSKCCGSQMDNHSAGFCLAKGFFIVSIFRHFCVFATQKSAAHATALPAARTNAAAHNTAEPQPRMELELSFTEAERLELGTSAGILTWHKYGHVNIPAPSKRCIFSFFQVKLFFHPKNMFDCERFSNNCVAVRHVYYVLKRCFYPTKRRP